MDRGSCFRFLVEPLSPLTDHIGAQEAMDERTLPAVFEKNASSFTAEKQRHPLLSETVCRNAVSPAVHRNRTSERRIAVSQKRVIYNDDFRTIMSANQAESANPSGICQGPAHRSRRNPAIRCWAGIEIATVRGGH